MTTYQVFWAFPNQEASVKCTPAFVQYLTEGKQGDKFEGFEIKGADHGFMCEESESFNKDASLIGWNLLMKEFN